ncbi:hypothetical protein GCM10028806_06250 [Spirosoma terrae]|uniref:Uncharacterized protein n=1 Tax=Spirosoma terrae TaxID=1968276 RepID=A0A6L9LIN1_9BACT|nr:hypothetical protein [Spirosoma terrae]NDU98548.1 hypothetical protein [Spirosoma terrae]
MRLSSVLFIVLVGVISGFQIRKQQPAICLAGEFRFGDLRIPYPATVGQIAQSYNMKFWGGGTFTKDTTLLQQKDKSIISFSLKHAKYQITLDNDPRERAEDNYDEPILEYRFTVRNKYYSFDSLRTMIERETGKTFRAFPATVYSASDSPWQRYLKGRTMYVYILRVSECMTITLRNTGLAIPEGIGGKTLPNTHVDFILYKSDAEVERLYMPRNYSSKVPAK